jgi:hypothetical protein
VFAGIGLDEDVLFIIEAVDDVHEVSVPGEAIMPPAARGVPVFGPG